MGRVKTGLTPARRNLWALIFLRTPLCPPSSSSFSTRKVTSGGSVELGESRLCQSVFMMDILRFSGISRLFLLRWVCLATLSLTLIPIDPRTRCSYFSSGGCVAAVVKLRSITLLGQSSRPLLSLSLSIADLVCTKHPRFKWLLRQPRKNSLIEIVHTEEWAHSLKVEIHRSTVSTDGLFSKSIIGQQSWDS